MIKNTNHKSVIFEKVFNFKKAFSSVYEKSVNTYIIPDQLALKKYWESVYLKGNSMSLTKFMKK